MRRCLIALALVGTLLVAGCAAPVSTGTVARKDPTESPAFHGAWQDRPFTLSSLTLTDTSGQGYNLRTSPSRPVTLVHFGYPDCPNGCSAVLRGLALALDRLPNDARDDVGVLVIDIAPDPAPAHQAQLRTWLDGIDPRFVGLTGPADRVHGLARELGVEIHEDADGTLIHGDQIIGFDRDRNGVLVWTSDVPVDQLAADLAALAALQR